MNYKAVFLILILVLSHSGFALSATKKSKECKKITNKIESIQKKMRSGYSTKKGAKYNEQLNKLYKQQFKKCF
ncbi:hypothetical protein C9J01_03005 [Photobacterium rosenbergii]|uniref:DUF1090 domain-containing protein n=1 Tax=Photobacterium rosenbergii TaxID=294936 RepID=A0A2T3NKL9_9GAMM|nr:hypothetical protein C9J01_03005 [Photobacterium rosenbergii]